VDGETLINFDRYRSLASGIQDALKYKAPAYEFPIDSRVMAFVEEQLETMRLILPKPAAEWFETRSGELVSREEREHDPLSLALYKAGLQV